MLVALTPPISVKEPAAWSVLETMVRWVTMAEEVGIDGIKNKAAIGFHCDPSQQEIP